MLIEVSEVVDIIHQDVEVNKRDLLTIYNNICDKLGATKLNNVDIAYIDRKFIKKCFECFKKDAVDCLKTCILDGNIDEFYEFLHNSDFHLEAVPDVAKDSDYYKLLINSGKSNLYSSIFRNFIISLKEECIKVIQTSFKNIELEVTFLNLIVDLIFERNLDPNFTNDVGLSEFLNNKGTISALIMTILAYFGKESVSLTTLEEELKKTCLELVNFETFLLERKLRDKLRECFLPVRIVRKCIDDRNIIEVIGQCLRISEILNDIESRLHVTKNETQTMDKTIQLKRTNFKWTFKKVALLFRMMSSMKTFNESKEISEVRFIGIRSITIDCNLSQEKWHGKNIVIVTKKLIINDQFTWDVSGKNAEHDFSKPATDGFTADDPAEDGGDGYAGESGGNVLVHAESVSDRNLFRIISSGGSGSTGQNGGNGYDGKNGKSIDFDTFCDYFPHGGTTKLLVFTVNELIRYKRRKAIIAKIKDLCSMVVQDEDHTFYEGQTSDGQVITFSRYTSSLLPYQEFMIFQGSKGEPASRGGLGGYGGQGGFDGEISVSESISDLIITESQEGENGKDGEGGKNGKPGQDGWDLAYTDYEYHYNVTYHGKDAKCKFDLSYHNEKASNRTYCDKKSSYLQIDKRAIKEVSSLTRANTKSETNTKQRHQHSNSKRQKSITKKGIMESYASKFNSSDKFSINLDQSKKLLSAIINADLSQSAQHGERVTRQVTHIKSMDSKKKPYKPINRKNCRKQEEGKNTIEAIKNQFKENVLGKGSKEEFETILSTISHQMIKYHHTRQQVKQIDEIINELKDFYMKSSFKCREVTKKLGEIKSNCLNKYKLSALHDISLELELWNSDELPKNIRDEFKVVLLRNVDEDEYVHIKNERIGPLINFFNSKCLESEALLQNYFQNKEEKSVIDGQKFTECMKYYILFADTTNKNIYECRKKYEAFLEKKKQEKRLLWKQIIDCIKLEEEDKLKDIAEDDRVETQNVLFKKHASFSLEPPDIDVLKDICIAFESTKENSLKFNEIHNKTFEWNHYTEDDNVIVSFLNEVLKVGRASDLYLALLCNLYNTALTLYIKNERNEHVVLKKFNQQAVNLFHIVKSSDGYLFVKPQTNEINFLCGQIYKENIEGNILLDVSDISNLEDIDAYTYEKYKTLSGMKSLYAANFISSEDNEDTYIDVIVQEAKIINEKRHQIENMKSEIIGKSSILYVLSTVFASQGFLISNDVFDLILLEIMQNAASEHSMLNRFAWIFATQPQKIWLNDVIYTKVLNMLKIDDPRSKNIRQEICSINSANVLYCLYMKLNEAESTINVSDIHEIVQLLNFSSEVINVTELYEMTINHWKNTLWKFYWQKRVFQICSDCADDLERTLYYLGVIQNMYGPENLKLLFTKMENYKSVIQSSDILQILRVIFNGDCDVTSLINMFVHSSELSQVISEVTNTAKDSRNESEIISILKSNSNNTKSIIKIAEKTELFLKDVEVKMQSILLIENFDFLNTENADDDGHETELIIKYINETPIGQYSDQPKGRFLKIMKVIRYHFKSKILAKKFETELYALIDQAIFISRGFYLRFTQKIATLLLYFNQRNTLAQVNTGEGKSLIVMTLASMKALRGEKVDVITCSRLLAMRDAQSAAPKGYKDIYNMFGINVSHNCSENIEDRIQAYSGNQIIYGDIGSFQRDYLLDRFYGKNIIGDRSFENVIIDEVDSMLLDKGNNMLYLSQDISGLEMLEPIFLTIWQTVNSSHSKTDTSTLKSQILSKYFYKLDYKELKVIDKNLTDTQMKEVYNILTRLEIVDCKGDIRYSLVLMDKLKKELETNLLITASRLVYYIELISKFKNKENMPQALKQFVYLHIDTWIENAITALLMGEGTDYIVDIDRTESKPDRNPIVTIIDNDTGTDLSNSQWENGLHQFLQLKHGCRLSRISLKAVFVSNVNYFKMYKKVHGLSGTLGSKVERDFLQDVHGVDFVSIPTAKIKHYEEYTPLICKSQTSHFENVLNECIHYSVKRRRAVLVICENILSAEKLHAYFKKHLQPNNNINIYLYKRDFEEFEFAQGNAKLQPLSIIIATNLAGRGTDIKLSEEVVANGGLHVCITFLPPNIRVEQQAFGRASRCGEPGSGRLVFQVPDDDDNILQIKAARETAESKHVANITHQYKNHIQIEEFFYTKFQKDYSDLRKSFKDLKMKYRNKEFKEISNVLLKTFIELWALWLNKTTQIQGKNVDTVQVYWQFKKVVNGIKAFTSSLLAGSNCLAIVSIENLKIICENYKSHITNNWLMKIASILIGANKFTNAGYIYDKIIETDYQHSEHAQYYKARVILNSISNWSALNQDVAEKKKFDEVLEHFKNAHELFSQRNLFCIQFAASASEIEQRQQTNDVQIIKIEALKTQKSMESSIYSAFIESIDTIIGKRVEHNNFLIDKINEPQSQDLFDALCSKKIINNFSICKQSIASKRIELSTLCKDLKVSEKVLRSCISKFENQESIKNITTKLSSIIPNANEFWNLLAGYALLKNERIYVVIDSIKIKAVDPSLASKLKNLDHGYNFNDMENKENPNYVFNGVNTENLKDKIVILKSEFEEKFGKKRLRSLLKRKMDCFKLIKHATFESMENEFAKIYSLYKMNSFFSKYDSIRESDFFECGIDIVSAKKIFNSLCVQELLVRDKNEHDIFRVATNTIDLKEKILQIDELYTSNIINLVNYHFSYRIAFEDIILQIKDTEKESPIILRLDSNPFMKIIYELVDKKFLNPNTVNPYIVNDIEETLSTIYPNVYSGNQILKFISEFGIEYPDGDKNLVLRHLLERGWIAYRNMLSEAYNELLLDDIDYLSLSYKILNLDEVKTTLSIMKDDQETVKQILNQYYLLSNKSIQKAICGKIKYMSPSLYTFNSPKFYLENLSILDHEKFRDEDFDFFKIRGLQYVISIREPHLSWKTIIGASVVIAVGLIELGVCVYTAVYAPCVSKVCMSEGISDIFYGCQALWSGKFNYKDYAQHKAISLLTSIAITGASNFGSSRSALAASNLPANAFDPNVATKGGMKLCEMTATQIVEFVGMKNIAIKSFQNIAIQIGNKFKNMALPHIVYHVSNNYLMPICKWISSYILTFLDFIKFSTHAIWNNLGHFFIINGRESLTIFKGYINEIYEGQSFTDIFSKRVSQFCSPIFGAINSVRTDSRHGDFFKKIQVIISFFTELKDLYTARFDVINLAQYLIFYVDKLNKRIESDISEIKKEIDEADRLNAKDFVKEAEAFLKQTMQYKASKYIQDKIIKPMVTFILALLTKAAEKYVQKKYVEYRENKHIKEYEKLSKRYRKDMESGDKTEAEINDFKKLYDSNLTKLMQKNRSSKLYSRILKDSSEMDVTGAKCACKIIASMPELQRKNVIFVIKSDEMEQEVSSGTEGDEIVIVLDVKDHHFLQGVDSVDNNCFFSAVEKGLKEQGIDLPYSHEELRNKTADLALTDPDIQLSLENGWHEFSISKGAIGGAEKHTRYVLEDLNKEEQRDRLEKIMTDQLKVDSKFKNVRFKDGKDENGKDKYVMRVVEKIDGEYKRTSIIYDREIVKSVADKVASGFAHIQENEENKNRNIVDEGLSKPSTHESKIYIYRSKIDESRTYVGQTSQTIKQRHSNHKSRFGKEVRMKDPKYLMAAYAKELDLGIKTFNELFSLEVIHEVTHNVRPCEVIFQNANRSSKHENGFCNS